MTLRSTACVGLTVSTCRVGPYVRPIAETLIWQSPCLIWPGPQSTQTCWWKHSWEEVAEYQLFTLRVSVGRDRRWWSGGCCHGDRNNTINIGKVMGNTLPCGGNQGKPEGVTNPSLRCLGLLGSRSSSPRNLLRDNISYPSIQEGEGGLDQAKLDSGDVINQVSHEGCFCISDFK